MNKYDTPKEALETCLKIWTYLAETGATKKKEAYENLGLPLTDTNNCPACEYTAQNGVGCEECPLYPENRTLPREARIICYAAGQPYQVWLDAGVCHMDDKCVAALGMVDLIKKRLGELE